MAEYKYLVVSSVFSPSMLRLNGEPALVKFEPITLGDAKVLVHTFKGVKLCTTGTRDMSLFLEDLYGLPRGACGRNRVRLEEDTLMLVMSIKVGHNATYADIKNAVDQGRYTIYRVTRLPANTNGV